jgi:PAT family beta-lactamase induction signal transducer AmpG
MLIPILKESARLRYITFFYLYIMQGIPSGFALTAIANYLVAKGVSPQSVGTFIAIVGVPWIIQFVWGPVIDRYQFSVIGHRKHWVVLTQIVAIIASLGLLLIKDPVHQLSLMSLLFFIHSNFASVQDASVDAIAISVVPPEERGRVNAFMRGGYLAGVALGSAGLSFIMHQYGFSYAVLTQSCILLFFTILTFLTKLDRHDSLLPSFGKHQRPIEEVDEIPDLKSLFQQLFRGMLQKRSLETFIVIAVVYFMFSIFIRSYTYHIIHVLKWSDQLVSVLQGSWGSILIFVVIIGGGVISDRIGHRKFQIKVMWGAGIYLILINVLSLTSSNNIVTGTGLVLWNFADPLFSVAAFPILMALCLKQVEGSQFTAYMALINFCDVLGSYVTGWSLSILPAPYIGLFCGTVVLLMVLFMKRRPAIIIDS